MDAAEAPVTFEPARDRSIRHSRFRGALGLLRVLSVVMVIATLWQLAVTVLHIRTYILPRPTAIIDAFAEHLHELTRATAVTVIEVAAGLLIAVALGTLVALPLALFRGLRQSVFPFLMALSGVPKVALAPMLVVWLGLGLESKVGLSALLAFFPITLHATRGLCALSEEAELFLRALCVSQWRAFYKIRLPAAGPSMLDGLRLAAPAATIGAIVGEFISSGAGLGYVVVVAMGQLQTALGFAALVCIALVASAPHVLIALIERRWLRWIPASQR